MEKRFGLKQGLIKGRVLLVTYVTFVLIFSPLIEGVAPVLTAEAAEMEGEKDAGSSVDLMGNASSYFGAFFDPEESDDSSIDNIRENTYEFAGEMMQDERVRVALADTVESASNEEDGDSTLEEMLLHILQDGELHEMLGDVIASLLLLKDGTPEREFAEQMSADVYALLQDDSDGSFKEFIREALNTFLNDPRVSEVTEEILFLFVGYTGEVVENLGSAGSFEGIPELLGEFADYMRDATEGTEMANIMHGVLDNLEDIPEGFAEALREDPGFNRAMENLTAVFWDALADPMFGDLEGAGVLDDYLGELISPECPTCEEGDPQPGCPDCGGGLWGAFQGMLQLWMAVEEGEECFTCGGDDPSCPYCPIKGGLGAVLEDISGDIDLGIEHFAEGATGDNGNGEGCEAEEQMADFLMHWADVLFAMFSHEEFSDLLMEPLMGYFTDGEGAYHLEDMADLLMENLDRSLELLMDEESPVAPSIEENILNPLDEIMEELGEELFDIAGDIVGEVEMEGDYSDAAEEFSEKLNEILEDVFPEHFPAPGEEEGGGEEGMEEIEVSKDLIDRLFDNITTISSFSDADESITIDELADDIAAYMGSICSDPECNCGLTNAKKIGYDLASGFLEDLADGIETEAGCDTSGCTEEDPCIECIRDEEREELQESLIDVGRMEQFYEDLGGKYATGDEEYPVDDDSGVAGIVWSVIMEILAGEDLEGFYDSLDDDFSHVWEDEDGGVLDYGKRIGAAALGFVDRIFAPFLKLLNSRRYVYDYEAREQQRLEGKLSEERIASSLRWIISPTHEFLTESKFAQYEPHPEAPGRLTSFPDSVIRQFLGDGEDEYDALGIIASPERISVITGLLAEVAGARERKELEAGYFATDLSGELPGHVEDFVERFDPERLDEEHPGHGDHIDPVEVVNEIIDGVIDNMLICSSCNGEGGDCEDCAGTGKTIGDCTFCDGEGEVEGGELCENCDGTGEAEVILVGFDDWTGGVQDFAGRLRRIGDMLEEIAGEDTAVDVVNIPARLMGLFDEEENARDALEELMEAPVDPVVDAVAEGLQGEDLRNTLQNLVADLSTCLVGGIGSVVEDILSDQESREFVTQTVTEAFTFGDLPGQVSLLLKDFLEDDGWIGYVETDEDYYHMCDSEEEALEPVPVDAHYDFELGSNGGGLEYFLRLSLYYASWYGHSDYEDVTAYRAESSDGPARFYQVTYREEICDIDFLDCEMGQAAYQGLGVFFDLLMEWIRGEELFDGDDHTNPRVLQAPSKFLPHYFEDFYRYDFAGEFIPRMVDVFLNVAHSTLSYEDSTTGRGMDDMVSDWLTAALFLRDDPEDDGLVARLGEILQKEYDPEELDNFDLPDEYANNPEEYEPHFAGLLKDVLIGLPDGEGSRDLDIVYKIANILKYDPNDPEYPVPGDPVDHPPAWLLKEHIGVTYAILVNEIADFLTEGWRVSEIVGTGQDSARHFAFTPGLPVTPGTLELTVGDQIAVDEIDPCGDCSECEEGNEARCADPEGYFVNPEPGKELVQDSPPYNSIDYDTGEVELSIRATPEGADIVARWMPDLIGSMNMRIDPGQLKSALQVDREMHEMFYDLLSGGFTTDMIDNILGFLEAEEEIMEGEEVSRAYKAGYILQDIPARFMVDLLAGEGEGEPAELAEFAHTAATDHLGDTLIEYELGSKILDYLADLVINPTLFDLSVKSVFDFLGDFYQTFTRRIRSFGGFLVGNTEPAASGVQEYEVDEAGAEMLEALPTAGVDTLKNLAGTEGGESEEGGLDGTVESEPQAETADVEPAVEVDVETEEIVYVLEKLLETLNTDMMDEVLYELLERDRFDDMVQPGLDLMSGIAADGGLADAVGGALAQNLQDGRLAEDIDFFRDTLFDFLYDKAVYEDVNQLLIDLLKDEETEAYVDKVVDEGIEIARVMLEDAVRGILLELWREDPADPESEVETSRMLAGDFISAVRQVLEGSEEQVGLGVQIQDMFTDERFAEFLEYMAEMLTETGLETWVSLIEDDRFKIIFYEMFLEGVNYGFSGFEEVLNDTDLTAAIIKGVDEGISASGTGYGYDDGYAFVQDSVSGMVENMIYKDGYLADYFLNSFYAIMEEAPTRPDGGVRMAADALSAPISWFAPEQNIVEQIAAELSVIPPELINEVFFDWLMFGGEESPEDAGTYLEWGENAAAALSPDLITAAGAALEETQDYAVDFLYHEEYCGECEICEGGGECSRKEEIMHRVVNDLYCYFFCPEEGEYDGIVESIWDDPRMAGDPDHPGFRGKYYREITLDHSGIAADSEDFQVQVKLNEDNFDFAEARSDGHDVRFKCPGGSLLDFERMSHDASSETAEYRVELPFVSRREDTRFYIYYGNPDASDASTTLEDLIYFTENFEGTSFPPAGWSRATNIEGHEWERSTEYAFCGEASACIEWTLENLNAELYTPWVELGDDPRLVFREMTERIHEYYDDHYRIWVDDGDRFTRIDTLDSSSSSWREHWLDLRDYAGEEIRAVFQYYGPNGENWHLDDVVFTDAYAESSLLDFSDKQPIYLPTEMAENLVNILPLEEMGDFLEIPVYYEMVNRDFRDADFPPAGWGRTSNLTEYNWERQTDIYRSGGAAAGFERTEPRVAEDELFPSQDFDSVIWPPPRWNRWNDSDNIVSGWVQRSECVDEDDDNDYATGMAGTGNRTHLGDALRDEGYSHGEYDIHSMLYTPWFELEDLGDDTFAQLIYNHMEGENDGRASLKKAEVRVEYYDDDDELNDELLETYSNLPGSEMTVEINLDDYAGKEIRIYFEFLGEGSLHSAWYQTSTRWYIYEWLIGDVSVVGNIERRPAHAEATIYSEWLEVEDGFELDFHETSKESHSYLSHVVGVQDQQTQETIYTRELGRAPEAPDWRRQRIDLSEFAGRNVRVFFRYRGAGADSWYIDDFRIRGMEDYVDKNKVYNVLERWGDEAVGAFPLEEVVEDFLDGSCGECEGCLEEGPCEDPTISGTLKEAFSGFTQDLLGVLVESDLYHAFIDSISGFPVENITGFLEEEYDPEESPGQSRADLAGEVVPAVLLGKVAEFIDYRAEDYPLVHGEIEDKRETMSDFIYYSILELIDEFGDGSPGQIAVDIMLEELLYACGECDGCATEELCDNNLIVGLLEGLLEELDDSEGEPAVQEVSLSHLFHTAEWEDSPAYFTHAIAGWLGIEMESLSEMGIFTQDKGAETLLSESFADTAFPPVSPDWERETNVEGFGWERYTSHAYTGEASAGVRHGGEGEGSPAGMELQEAEDAGGVEEILEQEGIGGLTGYDWDGYTSDLSGDGAEGEEDSGREEAQTRDDLGSDSPEANIEASGLTQTAGVSVNTQSGNGMPLSEDFSGSFPPSGWQTTGGENWEQSDTSNAGGDSPEARFNWSPDVTATQRLIAPELDTSGMTELTIMFRHNINHFASGDGNYEIKLQTTSDGGSSWNTIETWPAADLSARQEVFSVDNNDVGSDQFQAAWVFDGRSYDINQWYVDDVYIYEAGEELYTVTLDYEVTEGFTNGDLSDLGGIISGAGQYSPGDTVTVVAEDATGQGQDFLYWTGNKASNDREFTFTMPERNISLTAEYRNNRLYWLGENHAPFEDGYNWRNDEHEVRELRDDHLYLFSHSWGTGREVSWCSPGVDLTDVSEVWMEWEGDEDAGTWGGTRKHFFTVANEANVSCMDDPVREYIRHDTGFSRRTENIDVSHLTGEHFISPHARTRGGASGKESWTFTYRIWLEEEIPEPPVTEPQVTNHPDDVTVTDGEDATFNVTADGTLPLDYQWRRNNGGGWSDISGATEDSYTIDSADYHDDDGAQFKCVVSNDGGTDTSNAATLTVDPIPPDITSHPSDQMVDDGDNVSFSVAVEGTEPFDYQWERCDDGGSNWGEIEGADDYVYTLNNADYHDDDGAVFRCLVSNPGEDDVPSDAAELTVEPIPPQITGPDDVTVDDGDPAEFSVEVEGTEPFDYQWERSDDGGSEWSEISGATGDSYILPPTQYPDDDGALFRCVVSNPAGDVASDAAQLTVEPVLPDVDGPEDEMVEDGATATFEVDATGTEPFSYQWQVSLDDGGTWEDIEDETESSYTTPTVSYPADNGLLFRCKVENAAGTTISDEALLTVTSTAIAPSVTSHPEDQAVGEGEPATFEVSASGTAPLSYQWQRSDDGGATWEDIDGADESSYTTPETVHEDDDGAQFRCVVSNEEGSDTSDPATLTVELYPPDITSHPGDQAVEEGQEASFSVEATGAIPLSYQWRRSDDGGGSWSDIGGATSETYTIPSAEYPDDDGAWFKCVVTNDQGTAISNPASLTVFTEEEEYYSVTLDHAVTEGFTHGDLSDLGGIISGEGQYQPGDTVTVIAEEADDVGQEFLYWTGTRVSTDREFTFNMPEQDVSLTAEYRNSRLYWLGEDHAMHEGGYNWRDDEHEIREKRSDHLYLYSHSWGNGREVSWCSPAVDLTDVEEVRVDWYGIGDSGTFISDARHLFTVATEPDVSCRDDSVEEYIEYFGGFSRRTESINLSGYTGDHYISSHARTRGCTSGKDSETFTYRIWLVYEDIPEPPVDAPAVIEHPDDVTVEDGETATFSVTSDGTMPFDYQWERSDDDGGTWEEIAGATGRDYITPATVYAEDDGAQFRCVVSNDGGTDISNAATLEVEPIAPEITTHPANQTVDEGETASFGVSAAGSEPLSYQWQRSVDGGYNWSNIAGATNSSYTTPETVYAEDDGTMFRCVVSNDGGSATSGEATLQVNPLPPEITDHPEAQTVNDGDTAAFSVTATGTEPFSYQWQRSDDYGENWDDIEGATESSYTKAETVYAEDDGVHFRCAVSNDADTVNSEPATLTVTPLPPSIVEDPEDQMVGNGGIAEFSVEAEGTEPLSYQWQYSGDEGSSWSDIEEDANESTYTTPPAVYPEDDGAQFRCVVSNDEGTVESEPAVLTVTEEAIPPEITEDPADQTVDDGAEASFSVAATGTVPLSYQWQRSDDGGSSWDDIFGATARTYTILETVHAEDDGARFRCKVSNEADTATSGEALLEVTPLPPVITYHPANQAVEEGQDATFSVTAEGTEPLSYQWQRSDDEGGSWNNIAGETESSYSVHNTDSNEDDGARFRCVVSNEEGAETSDEATLIVYLEGEEYYLVTLDSEVTEGFTDGDQSELGGIIGGAGQYAPGDTVTVEAEAGGAGYDFLYWSGDKVSTQREFEFTMPTYDVELKAEYQNNRIYWYGEEHVPIVEGYIYCVGADGAASIKYSNYLYKHTGERRSYRPRRMWETDYRIDLTDVDSLAIDWESTSHDHSWQWVFGDEETEGDPYDGGTDWSGELDGAWDRVTHSWNIGESGAATGEQYVGWGVGKGNRVWPQGANWGELFVWRVWLDGVPHPDPPVEAPQVIAHPDHQTVYEGKTAFFSVEVDGTGPFTYQWQRSDDDGQSWQDIGETYSTRYITDETVYTEDHGAKFRCVVSNEAGEVASEEATLTVISDPPEIISHPENQTVDEGETATFSVEADSGAPEDYQWQRYDGDGWNNIDGATGESYTTPETVYTEDDGAQFRCVVTNEGGSVTSDAAVLTVLPGPAEIITQPEDQTVYDGDPATFSVEASGSDPLSYQWQLSPDGGDNWMDLEDATEAEFTTPETIYLDDDGLQFRCKVSNEQGEDVSEEAVLTVLPVPPVITTHPGDQTVEDGEAASFVCLESGGTAPVTYQWQRSDDGGENWEDIPGAIGTVFSIQETVHGEDDGAQFRCVVTNIHSSVESEAALLTVGSVPPEIITPPADRDVAEGDTATFSVDTDGTLPMSYQWQRSDDGGESWDNIPGAMEADYTTQDTVYTEDDGALFRCVVNNDVDEVTSEAAALSVIPYIDATLYTPWIEIDEEYRGAELNFRETGERQEFYEHHAVGVEDEENNRHLLKELGPAPEGSWEKRTANLSNYTGQTVRLYFHYEGTNADDWYVDDIEVRGLPEVYDLTLEADPAVGGEVIDVTGDSPYLEGEEVEVTAAPHEGYKFVNWTVNGEEVSTEKTFAYTMPGENVTLTANFVPLYELMLEADPEEGGTVTDETGDGHYLEGEAVIVTASSNEGYQFVDWSVDGEMVSMDKTLEFEMPAGDTVLTANFIDDTAQLFMLTLEADPEEGGSVTGGRLYEEGEVMELAAEANTGYEFVSWTEGEEVVSTEPVFDYEMPGDDTTLTANFAIIDYTINIEASEGGSVEPEGEFTYNYDDVVNVEAVADEGYGFVKWTANGLEVSTEKVFDFRMPAEDVILTANFGELYQLTLSADPPDGGTAAGEGFYTAGTTVKVTAEANEGYMFARWEEGGTARSTQPTFSYTMPEGNAVLTAIFVEAGVVYIPDINLKKSVEFALFAPNQEITTDSIQGLYSLSASSRSIEDLTGLEFAGNLRYIDLHDNHVDDLWMLENLTELEELHLSYNDITGVKNLGSLYNLKELDLSFNELGEWHADDVDALKGLESLEILNLSGNDIDDLAPLEELQNLRYLDLSHNNVSDIGALENLTNLERLNLSGNDINNFEVLEGLENLERLDVSGNQFSRVDRLSDLNYLEKLSLSSTDIDNTELADLADLPGLESLELADNNIQDLDPEGDKWLEEMANLQALDLSGNNIEDISDLQVLSGLEELNLADNQVESIEPLVEMSELHVLNLSGSGLGNGGLAELDWVEDLPGLSYLYLADNQISDLSPLVESQGGHLVFKELDLSQNELSDVGKDPGDPSYEAALEPLRDVEFIQVREQFRMMFRAFDFALEDLEYMEEGGGALDLSGNEIKDISPLKGKMFAALDLSFNRLDSEEIAHLLDMEFGSYLGGGLLDLSSNQIENLNTWAVCPMGDEHCPTCTVCDGTGEVEGEECNSCGGSGLSLCSGCERIYRMDKFLPHENIVDKLDVIYLCYNDMGEIYDFNMDWFFGEMNDDYVAWSILTHIRANGAVAMARRDENVTTGGMAISAGEEDGETAEGATLMEDGTEVIEGATVTVQENYEGGEVVATGVTDEEGKFELGVPGGNYLLQIEHFLFETAEMEIEVDRGGTMWVPEKDVGAVEMKPLGLHEIHLIAEDVTGRELSEAVIKLIDKETDETKTSTEDTATMEEGEEGVYTLAAPEGSFRLEADHPGFLPLVIEDVVVNEDGDLEGVGEAVVLERYGDVLNDGAVGIADVMEVLRYAAGLDDLDEDALRRARVSVESEEVSIRDAVLILQKVVGLLDEFPVSG